MGIAEMPSILCPAEFAKQGLLLRVMPDWQFEEVDLRRTSFLGVTHPA